MRPTGRGDGLSAWDRRGRRDGVLDWRRTHKYRERDRCLLPADRRNGIGGEVQAAVDVRYLDLDAECARVTTRRTARHGATEGCPAAVAFAQEQIDSRNTRALRGRRIVRGARNDVATWGEVVGWIGVAQREHRARGGAGHGRDGGG